MRKVYVRGLCMIVCVNVSVIMCVYCSSVCDYVRVCVRKCVFIRMLSVSVSVCMCD